MKPGTNNSDHHRILVDQLTDLLLKGNAHVSLDEALENIPFAILGERPNGLPYSIWQLAEHIRIAQWDIMEFSRSAAHVSPKWPDEYWPTATKPSSEKAWEQCVAAIKSDRQQFIDLLSNAGDELYTPFEHGDGQTLLKEALVIADHNAYHTGEIMILRRLLNAWK